MSCDDEFKEIGCIPETLDKLNDFVYYWNIMGIDKRKTLVSLVNESYYTLDNALKRVLTGKSYITPVSKPPLVEQQDEVLGQFYAADVIDYKIGNIATCFDKSTTLEYYFDYEAYGRDIRLNGENGYWSEMYDRWVVNPIGNLE
jgi:hypothetical protein